MAADFDALKRDLQRRMDGAMDTLKKEFAGLRTGRASPALLEPIRVEAYGSNQPLNQVANISIAGPGLLSVQVWDRSVVKAAEVAIRDAGLGLLVLLPALHRLHPVAADPAHRDLRRLGVFGGGLGELVPTLLRQRR